MMRLRRRELPVLTEADVRRIQRPHSGCVKGDSPLVKADRAIHQLYIAPMRERSERSPLMDLFR